MHSRHFNLEKETHALPFMARCNVIVENHFKRKHKLMNKNTAKGGEDKTTALSVSTSIITLPETESPVLVKRFRKGSMAIERRSDDNMSNWLILPHDIETVLLPRAFSILETIFSNHPILFYVHAIAAFGTERPEFFILLHVGRLPIKHMEMAISTSLVKKSWWITSIWKQKSTTK